MRNLSALGFAIFISLAVPATLARGMGTGLGLGLHHSSGPAMPTGGAFGERVTAPGTNSLGTALSSSSFGSHPQKGPLLGTSPAVDREETRVDKALASVCRGC